MPLRPNWKESSLHRSRRRRRGVCWRRKDKHRFRERVIPAHYQLDRALRMLSALQTHLQQGQVYEEIPIKIKGQTGKEALFVLVASVLVIVDSVVVIQDFTQGSEDPEIIEILDQSVVSVEGSEERGKTEEGEEARREGGEEDGTTEEGRGTDEERQGMEEDGGAKEGGGAIEEGPVTEKRCSEECGATEEGEATEGAATEEGEATEEEGMLRRGGTNHGGGKLGGPRGEKCDQEMKPLNLQPGDLGH